MRHLLSIVTLLMLLAVFAGCSSASNLPTQPDNSANQSEDTEVLFTGSFDIDIETQTITKADNRQSDFVYDITGFLPDKCPGGCFRIEIIGVVGTVLEIELTLENPTAIQVYDARVEYLNLFGKTVLNPDSYTDFLGTPITDVYPFTAFTKEYPDRAFPVGPGGIDTEIMFLDFPPGAPSTVNYAIIAHLPGQTGEPYEIGDMAQDGILTPDGGTATISCNVYDHQDDISGVFMDASPFTGAPLQLLPGVDPDSFECELENILGAPIGVYNQLIMALSPNPQNISTYNYVQIEVTEITENIIYVDDSNTTGIEDGTQANPYDTIVEGLDAALAGWKVYVDDSGNDYEGPITLKSDVILKSVNWDDSDGTDMAAIYSTGGTPVVTGADGATIDGFKVYGGSVYGIRVSEVDTTIKNCLICDIIRTSTAYGVYIENSTGSSVVNCEITNIRNTTAFKDLFGLSLIDSPITVSGNDIHDIVGGDSYHSAYLLYASNCVPRDGNHLTITHNKIHDLRIGAYSYPHGIYVSGSPEAEVKNNLVYSITCGDRWYNYGIRFSGSDDVSFINNTVYDIRMTACFYDAFGVHVSSCANFDGRNNIVTHIKHNVHNTRAFGVSAPADVTWKYCNVWDADDGLYTGGIIPGTGCISWDPLFVDVGIDFHLIAASPCVDAGDPAILDPNGSRSDMGCYGGPGGDW